MSFDTITYKNWRQEHSTSKKFWLFCLKYWYERRQKADSIAVKASKDKDTSYVNQYAIYMNKKAVTVVNLSDFYCNYSNVRYVKISKILEFLQIIGHGDNDYIVYNELFTYNKKTKQFYTVNSFHKRNIYATEIISANKNDFVISLGKLDSFPGHFLINTKKEISFHLQQP